MTLISRDPISSTRTICRNRKFSLRMVVEPHESWLSRFILEPLPRTLPEAHGGETFAQAEAALRQGELLRAEALYRELAENYPTQGWANLRLIDMQLLDEGPNVACPHYEEMAKRHTERTISMLVGLRALAAECAISVQPVESFLERAVELEPRLSEILLKQILNIFKVARHPNVIEVILEALNDSTKSAPASVQKLKEHLLSRLVYLAPSNFHRATYVERYGDVLAKHSEGHALLLLGARAQQSLDMDSFALNTLQRLNALPRRTLDRAWSVVRGAQQSQRLFAQVLAQMHRDSDFRRVWARLRADYPGLTLYEGGASVTSQAPAQAPLQTVATRIDAIEHALAPSSKFLETQP